MTRDADHIPRRPGGTTGTESRRRYVPPRLDVVRALREVVLGSGPGAGDSGGGYYPEMPPGGGP